MRVAAEAPEAGGAIDWKIVSRFRPVASPADGARRPSTSPGGSDAARRSATECFMTVPYHPVDPAEQEEPWTTPFA